LSLTNKQRQFCIEYIVDLNGTQAAIRAGYSARSARQVADLNMSKHDIQFEIARLQAERSRRTQITADRVLEELSYIAFSRITDVTSFSNSNFSLKNSDVLPDWAIAAIQEVGQIEAGKSTKTYAKLHDKKTALKLVMQHLGLDNDFNRAIATLRKYGLVLRQSDSGAWEVTPIDADTTNLPSDTRQQEDDGGGGQI